MKKRKVILLLVLFSFLFGILYLAGTIYLSPSSEFQPIYLVPEDAIYIVETDEPVANWQQVSSSPIWKHLQGNAYFNELTASANQLDSLIKSNQTIFNLIGSRNLTVSAHKYKKKDYDFLMIVDLQKASKLTIFRTYFNTLVGSSYQVTRRDYKQEEIIEMTDKETRETLYLSFIDNLVICSYVHTLVENAITQKEEPVIGRDLHFLEVNRKVAGKGMFRFYMQYNMLDDYMECYLDESNDYIDAISQQIRYSGLSFKLDDNDTKMVLNGFTNVNDTVDSYLLAMLKAGKGGTQITQVVPERTAFYFGMGFDSFLEFFERVEEIALASLDTYQEYKDNVYKLEKFLGISLKDDFLGWMGDEVAFVQTQPGKLGKENEFAVVFKAKKGALAKEKLDFISERIKKKTPVKFKNVEYKNYSIQFLSVKGFFKLILGKFFAGLEKPYYTIIDDYVIFSNHPQTIRSIIDDYISGKTLAKSASFNSFRSNFSKLSNIFIYVQTPVLHQNLKGLVDPETWKNISVNKDYIVCFSDVGFQLTKAGDNLFETNVVSQFKPITVLNEEETAWKNFLQARISSDTSTTVVFGDTLLPTMMAFREIDPKSLESDEVFSFEEINIDDLDAKKQEEYYENGNLKFEVSLKDGKKHGSYREYYENGALKVKGRFRDDVPTGTWREYDQDGKTIKKERFNGISPAY